MNKPKYDLEDLTIFATYDGVDAHTNFVAEVAGSALDIIRGHERKVERLQEQLRLANIDAFNALEGDET